ncbi:Fe(3+)-hydroxamate ABC transporter substrate-binding protein FhuD [Shimwellia blattae]|uniref:Ferrichrome-binding periplasmic protein n=1 Tax=Shimwellia blattae (strain ATCC 29907 / DSM 4481 / JCM 1650 / NBRC 105725 / CDC 9005-74) TaxID=630626 RepID=I2BCM0_SHIBC|nr:Fe(3+)-hydroxamate ABC transporter substrate-binding protein FhuD [Shimwellia blattae]AFJ48274.1 ferrichrome-binding periplasmic protein precursor [Shimwellia blattae DSM 4481 = NBRC 105725]GAB80969.1 Fe(3+)-ferrichrome ABC transporter substrate-binding protein [Shimwellia blattae DSM 4481 = NBRC 105725]VDY65770.1 Iron(III)-hydroxamate-binding protein fhuD [Shimwellia blattae]VEC25701.1 Iron(III)-hydroxamate-binding protein fhuD [Shimwellia blattae]
MNQPVSAALSRRRLLTLMALSPLLWRSASLHAAPVDSQRVVALEWLPVELLIALGVTPLAVADTSGYRSWVGQPALPQSVVDLGLRTEPNLELLAQLKPSLMVYSSGFGPAPEKIARIAPGFGVTFSDGRNPLNAARASITALGARLGLEDRARAHLADFDGFIRQMAPRFAGRQRPVLLMSLLDPRHALVIGQHSLFQQVMDLLGIENAWQGEVNFWGSSVVGIERLAEIRNADVICFDHDNDTITRQVMATPLWQALPFVRQRRFWRAPPVWFYGATLSAMHFIRLIDKIAGGRA